MFVILYILVSAVCSTICLCFRFYSHIYAVQFVVLRDFYQILWDMVSEVYFLNNCSILYTMLATLTTIATPRYSGGVGVSGDVGRSLGPFVHCYFYLQDSDSFFGISFHAFCDYPCSDSVQLI